jgi:MoaA/NifB/PqqE/SkfB family radical SAM enzyme
MGVGEHIHWYITDRCNLNCEFCFKPAEHHSELRKSLQKIVKVLVENQVKKVTIGGGEPTLVRSLENIMAMLKTADIYVSLHTNGILLDKFDLKGLVDDVALPIDSVCPHIQEGLRGKKFMRVFKKLPDIVDKLNEEGISVGYHTVFSAANYLDISNIYTLIKCKDFRYWRIYEFNPLLSKNDSLQIPGNIKNGCVDSLFAYFLKMEEYMQQYGDDRIQFVGVRDYKEPYAFLDNSGNMSFYAWWSGRERRVIGNIHKDGFDTVVKKLTEVHEKAFGFDDKSMDEFNEATLDAPIWMRMRNGDFSMEELEGINPAYVSQIAHLAKLYLEREKNK